MDEKQYSTARNNEESPAPGMASVNTHNPTEESTENGERDLGESEADYDREEAVRQRHTGPQLGHRQSTESDEEHNAHRHSS